MKEAQKSPVNRCFGNMCQDPERQKQERIKEILLTAAQRKRANREIDYLLRQFKGKKIIDLLPVIKRRLPTFVLKVALERVEGRKNDLNLEYQMFLEEFKASLKE